MLANLDQEIHYFHTKDMGKDMSLNVLGSLQFICMHIYEQSNVVVYTFYCYFPIYSKFRHGERFNCVSLYAVRCDPSGLSENVKLYGMLLLFLLSPLCFFPFAFLSCFIKGPCQTLELLS